MTLSVSAAERRHLLSIDISCPPGAQQQTRRTPLLLSIDGTDNVSMTTSRHDIFFSTFSFCNL